MKINENYLRLEESYLFASIAHKLAAWKEANPRREVIRLGIGDVTLPLVPAVTEAMHKAVDEMGRQETFHGYGPEQGYPFLREAVCGYYAARGTIIGEDEIFVSDGAKSDLGNILDVLSLQNTVLIPTRSTRLRGNQRHGRAGYPVSERQQGERLPAAARPGAEGGYHLPVLAQQPDRGGLQQGSAAALGGICTGARRADSLRRGL